MQTAEIKTTLFLSECFSPPPLLIFKVDPGSQDYRSSLDGGESKTYTILIPSDHPAGLCWYHNHNHGTSSYSMLSGLSGIIEVVDPKTSALSQPEVAAATQKYLLLGESKVRADKTPADYIEIVFDFGWTSVANGQAAPTMTVKMNEAVLFRAASASVEPDHTLKIHDPTLGIVQLMPIAMDGHPITGATSLQDTVTIIPGGRVEFMAKFSTAGTYKMTRAAWNMGITGADVCGAVFGPDAAVENCVSYDSERDVLTIVVEPAGAGDPNMQLPTSVTVGAGALLDGLAVTSAISERTVTMQMLPQVGNQILAPEAPPPGYTQFGMNGRIAHPLYEHPDPFLQGTCETWNVGAVGDPVSHPFHLHGMPFLVTHESGVSLETPVWRDTYHTPVVFGAEGPETSSFTAHVCFPRWNAYIMAHCHMPSHADLGMAAIFTMEPCADDLGLCEAKQMKGKGKGKGKKAKKMKGKKSPKGTKSPKGPKKAKGSAQMLKQSEAAQDRAGVGAAVAWVGMIGSVALIATITLYIFPATELVKGSKVRGTFSSNRKKKKRTPNFFF